MFGGGLVCLGSYVFLSNTMFNPTLSYFIVKLCYISSDFMKQLLGFDFFINIDYITTSIKIFNIVSHGRSTKRCISSGPSSRDFLDKFSQFTNCWGAMISSDMLFKASCMYLNLFFSSLRFQGEKFPY